MKKPILLASILVVLLFVPAIPGLPQSDVPEAHISGTITDPSGAGVGGVQITAQLENSPSTRPFSVTSSAEGAYTLSLPPGRYLIHIPRDPFAARDFTLELTAGESRVVDLRLELERLSSSVVVTAETEPVLRSQTIAPTDVITGEEIEQRQAVTLPDLLLYSPGVAIDRTGPFGGTSSLFLNGGNSDFTKILVDGTPINPPGSAVDFSSLTTENIDKVEIVRGAESAIYGSDAVSGVVQLFTHRGETRIPSADLYSEGGGFSSARGGGDLSGLLGKFDYSGAAAYFQTDGQGPDDAFLNRTFSGNFLVIRFRIPINSTSLCATMPAMRKFPGLRLFYRLSNRKVTRSIFFQRMRDGSSSQVLIGTTRSPAQSPTRGRTAWKRCRSAQPTIPSSSLIVLGWGPSLRIFPRPSSPLPVFNTKWKMAASTMSCPGIFVGITRRAILIFAIRHFPGFRSTSGSALKTTPALARASFPA